VLLNALTLTLINWKPRLGTGYQIAILIQEMSDPPTRMRPPSFSESHIYLPRLPRVESNQKPLILMDIDDLSINRVAPIPRPIPQSTTWAVKFHLWATKFALHLTFISAFETLFFWLYVSASEDAALVGLINNYVTGAVAGCHNLTVAQRFNSSAIIAALVNQTNINAAGVAAATDRAIYNGLLLRNSWLYCSAIAFVFVVLAAGARLRRINVNWKHLVGENAALVTLLGIYELMFFRTVIFRYRATTMEELDQMVVGELMDAC
jgi:hypothetical protein